MNDRIKVFLAQEQNQEAINTEQWQFLFENASADLKNRDFELLVEIIQDALRISLDKDRDVYLNYILTKIFDDYYINGLTISQFIKNYILSRVGFSTDELCTYILDNANEWDVKIEYSDTHGDYVIYILRRN